MYIHVLKLILKPILQKSTEAVPISKFPIKLCDFAGRNLHESIPIAGGGFYNSSLFCTFLFLFIQ